MGGPEARPAKVRLRGQDDRQLVIRTIAGRRFGWLQPSVLVVGIAGVLAGVACLAVCGWGTVGLGGM